MDWALDTAPRILAVMLPTNTDFLSKRFRAGQGVRGTKFHVMDMEQLNRSQANMQATEENSSHAEITPGRSHGIS